MLRDTKVKVVEIEEDFIKQARARISIHFVVVEIVVEVEVQDQFLIHVFFARGKVILLFSVL